MNKRSKMPYKKGKKVFSKTADLTHKRNLIQLNPMRGGIRL